MQKRVVLLLFFLLVSLVFSQSSDIQPQPTIAQPTPQPSATTQPASPQSTTQSQIPTYQQPASSSQPQTRSTQHQIPDHNIQIQNQQPASQTQLPASTISTASDQQSTAGQEFVVTIKKGWNLIGLPEDFANVRKDGDFAYFQFNAQHVWQKVDTPPRIGGFWVDASTDGTLTYFGGVSVSTVQVYQGNNIISIPSRNPITTKQIFLNKDTLEQAIQAQKIEIYAWTDEGYSLVESVAQLQPGKGYVLKTQEKGELKIDNDQDGYVSDVDCNENDAAVHPGAAEECNNVDDDCNHMIDMVMRDCYSLGLDDTSLQYAPCRKGTQPCPAGTWGDCSGEVIPSLETCDGKDNDCNGEKDDKIPPQEFYTQEPTNKEACPPGLMGCVNGQLQKIREETLPSSENCDNKDNNCDGSIDESVPFCGCSEGRQPATEICNRIDDDCDEKIDEDLVDATGRSTCRCANGASPQQESCNGVDDDCNGNIDDGLATAQEQCNGRDDDCNGVVDDMPPQEAWTLPEHQQKGECRPVLRTCQNGNWEETRAAISPSQEICDGKDNNCNGVDDDINMDSCYTGEISTKNIGACHTGVKRCVDGAEQCTGQIVETAELCDSVDNDCDTKTDEAEDNPCQDGAKTCTNGRCKLKAGQPCVSSITDTHSNDCAGEYCIHGQCADTEKICGDGYCDKGEQCASDCLAGIPVRYETFIQLADLDTWKILIPLAYRGTAKIEYTPEHVTMQGCSTTELDATIEKQITVPPDARYIRYDVWGEEAGNGVLVMANGEVLS